MREDPHPLPPHTGLLRDETLVLRQLLGYGDDIDSSFSPQNLGAKLKRSSMRDVLLVGLDIDTFQGYEHLIPDHQFHVGVSILDTRILEDMLLDPGAANQQDAIKSFQFTVGTSAYCRRASNKFIFGASQPVTIDQVKPRIHALLSPPTRDHVLVLHGKNSDLKILQHLEMDLAACSLYVIDNNKAAQFPLQLYYRYSLEKLLDVLSIPYANLHAAGNDAHFCLRALLMIAVRDAERCPSSTRYEGLLRLLRAVARAPRPLTGGEIWLLDEPQRQAKREAKVQAKARRKARRAARAGERLLQRQARDEAERDQGTQLVLYSGASEESA